MIDIEAEVFTVVEERLKSIYPKVYITSEETTSPAEYPAVSIYEADNYVRRSAHDSSNIEKYANVTYEVRVFSNKKQARKSEAKRLSNSVDDVLINLGFMRTSMRPVPMEDATQYQIITRYNATVSKDKVIHRR